MTKLMQEVLTKDSKIIILEIIKNSPDVILLNGDLGAGKTTFVGEFLKTHFQNEFEQSNFMSPTYSILNEYLFNQGQVLHYDLYRLKPNELDIEEVTEMVSDALITFIEWPKKIPFLKESLLEDFKVLDLEIEVKNTDRYFKLHFLN